MENRVAAGKTAKAAKRGDGESKGEGVRAAAKTVKITLTVSEEDARRFGVHAAMTMQTKSALFTEMVEANCRRYVRAD